MRDQNIINSFMPLHEKEWEARVFIDQAIKDKAEYALEAIARALSGRDEITLDYAGRDGFLEHTETLKTDRGGYVQFTHRHKMSARIREFVFYGNNRTQIWLEIINFWAGKFTIVPCGGASFQTTTKS